MDNPYNWLQNLVDQVPEILQPLIVALAAAIPYIEGEGAAGLGIVAGINPIVATLAAITGNVLCVIAVVLLGSRIRGGVVARRAARAHEGTTVGMPVAAASRGATSAGVDDTTTAGNVVTVAEATDRPDPTPTRGVKGRAKLRRWMVKFGVPGASILAPLALPTMLTAAFFVASGVRKEWVILWQIVAIVLWTGLVAAAATGLLAVLGW